MGELKAQLAKIGLPTTGLKAVLVDRLTEGLLKFSLSDDNFQHAPVEDMTAADENLPNCFPQVRAGVASRGLCTYRSHEAVCAGSSGLRTCRQQRARG